MKLKVDYAGYYESEIKGKNADELLSVIRSLRSRIGSLKNRFERPGFEDDLFYLPDPKKDVGCNRKFLKIAVEEYIRAGGDFKPTRTDLRGEAFNRRLPSLTGITYETDAHPLCRFKYVFELSDETAEKEKLLKGLKELYIGEWRRHYSPRRFGIDEFDGERWSLRFEFSDSRPVVINGDSSYPYNFLRLMHLLQIENKHLEKRWNLDKWKKVPGITFGILEWE